MKTHLAAHIGEEHLRAKKGASIWGLKVGLKQRSQPKRSEHRLGKEGRPKVDLSLLHEKLFSLLPCSLWWETCSARYPSCSLDISLRKRMATLPPSLGFVNMCTGEMIPRQLSYLVNDMSPTSSPLFVLVEAKSAWGGDAEEGGCW